MMSFGVWIVSTLLYIFGYFFSKLVMAAGYILNWSLTLNSNILDNPAVQIGWQITRDLSNLGFVFLIILIAFGTILRMGSFQIKSMLPKLIVAALLINFSLLIAAVFLDFAGVLMNYFFNSAYESNGGDGGIALALTGALSIHGFLDTPSIASASFTSFSAASLNYIASLLFLDIATVIGAITLMAIGFMFLVRYIIIGFLLIILPAAILSWVAGGKGWSDWSGKFFQYTFFGPLAGFYIYIALKTSQAITSLGGSTLVDFANSDPSGVVSNVAGNLGSLIIMVAMLIYGLSLAEKQCEIGGKAAVGIAKGITKSWGAFGLGGLGKLTGGKLDYKAMSEKAAKWGKDGKANLLGFKLSRGQTRLFRQAGEAGKEFAKTYGSGLNLPGNVFEEISTGMGSTSRKFRMEEDAELEKKEKEKKEKEEKKQKRLLAETINKTREEELSKLKNLLSKKEGDLRSSSVGFTADENKSKSIEAEIKKIHDQIEKATKEKTESDIDLESLKNEDLEKLKEEVDNLKKKSEAPKEDKNEGGKSK